jgi:hypothetical protein
LVSVPPSLSDEKLTVGAAVMVFIPCPPSLENEVAATAEIVVQLGAADVTGDALAHVQVLARTTHGRCVLGLGRRSGLALLLSLSIVC